MRVDCIDTLCGTSWFYNDVQYLEYLLFDDHLTSFIDSVINMHVRTLQAQFGQHIYMFYAAFDSLQNHFPKVLQSCYVGMLSMITKSIIEILHIWSRSPVPVSLFK